MNPICYLSTSHGLWRLVLGSEQRCKDGSLEDAQRCAKALKLTPHAMYWDGDSGQFEPFDTLQAAEADAFTLAHTLNQPRTTSAQNPLF